MIDKAVITPLISVVAMAVQLAFHKQIPQELQDQASMIILNLVLLYSGVKGIFTNYKKNDTNTTTKG